MVCCLVSSIQNGYGQPKYKLLVYIHVNIYVHNHVNKHVNKYVSMLESMYRFIGNNGKLLSTFSAKWLQTNKKDRTTTTL